ncbi:RiPP maturation radical SAM C-methyltransferase [Colwellia sp. RE-S-Sl-9]
MKADICLISMPYTSLSTPSLALGVLENYISQYGNTVHSVYGNLEFAKKIGLAEYEFINNAFNDYLIGEWTFSQSAFPQHDLKDEGFFALFRDLDKPKKQMLLSIRDSATNFIDDMAKSVLAKQPRIVGCTSTFQQNCASLALLRKIKNADPSIITLMGGANCEGVMGQTISEEFTWVDYVFSGECDDVIGEFIDKLVKGDSIDNHNLPYGFITQKNKAIFTDASTKKKAPRAHMEDMSLVSSPIFDSYFNTLNNLNLSEYISPGLLAETSRGCWWGAKQHCTFCGLNGGSMEHRSKLPEVAIEEMDYLSTRYNVNKFFIVDNILPVEYMNSVLPELADKYEYNIFYETKANLKKGHVEKLAKAGIKWIQPGIEGLHDDFLKIIKKGTTAIQNVAALKWCRSYGVRVTWNLLCDAPFEQASWYDEMAEWLPLVSHLHPPFDQMAKICYHRFSPYFNNPEQFGLTLEPTKSYQYVYPLSKNKLFNLAYFFIKQTDNTQGIYTLNFTFTSETAAHEKVQNILNDWSNSWLEGALPMLFMVDQGSQIIIMDTRKVATNFTHILTGLTATIYRMIAEPTPKARLLVKLTEYYQSAEETYTEEALEESIDFLIKNHLMIHLSKCYMSLAFIGESAEMLDNQDAPSGCIDLVKAANEL